MVITFHRRVRAVHARRPLIVQAWPQRGRRDRNGRPGRPMADPRRFPEQRERWGGFDWTDENRKKAGRDHRQISGGAAAFGGASAARPRAAAGRAETARRAGCRSRCSSSSPARSTCPTCACSRSRPSTRCSTSSRSAASTSRSAARRRACCAARTTCSRPATSAGSRRAAHHRGRAVHADRGRVPRRLRQCADGPDQRRQLRGPDRREHGRDPRRPRPRRDSEAGPQVDRQTSCPVGGPTTSRRWPSAITITGRNGMSHGSGRGGRVMKTVLQIAVGAFVICSSLGRGGHENSGLIVILLAWKIIKGAWPC
jgi:hypothetical protein